MEFLRLGNPENEKVMERVQAHLDETLRYFPEKRVVYISLYGSQNYGIDTPNSDVDTKVAILPCMNDIIFNHQPLSSTHEYKDGEQIDFKDLRLLFSIYRKQNINYIETLFTPYILVNPFYAEAVEKLCDNRESIARFNEFKAVCTMRGMAKDKYHSLFKITPSNKEAISKFGYDPKQLCHLLRLHDMLSKYINGYDYATCLQPNSGYKIFLKEAKAGHYKSTSAAALAEETMTKINQICDEYIAHHRATTDLKANQILNDVQYDIMMKYIISEVSPK